MVSRERVRESLIEQLRLRGTDTDLNLSLVDDYMSYFDEERKALKSLAEKGDTFKAISSTGKEYDKENPAVRNLEVFNRRMIDILKILNVTEAVEADLGEL